MDRLPAVERPKRIDHAAAEREKRIDGAVKCLDDLIVLIMERVAAKHQINPEELASACQPQSDDDDAEDY